MIHLMTRIFKWLTLMLFAYIGAAFLAKPQWGVGAQGRQQREQRIIRSCARFRAPLLLL